MDEKIDTDAVMPDLPNKLRFTPQEAALLLGVHRSTIYRWMEEGRMEWMQLGVKLKRIPRRSILDQLRIVC